MPGAATFAEPTGSSEIGAPEVTVVIPTRNRLAFLYQSVADALAQQDVHLEVVIVDDGSSDACLLRDVARMDRRIRIVRHNIHRGVSRARNTGIEHARGKWVAFFDDDDRWSPQKLRIQLDAAAATQASWAFAAALTIDARGRVLSATAVPNQASIIPWLLEFNPLPGGCSNAIVRADVVRAVGGFDERLSLIADWDLWIRLAEAGPPAACPDFLIGYRLHGDNMHVREIDAIYGELTYIARKYASSRLGQPVRPDLGLFLAWHANACRRAGRRSAAARLYLRRARIARDPKDLLRVLLALLGERVTAGLRRRHPLLPSASWPEQSAKPRLSRRPEPA